MHVGRLRSSRGWTTIGTTGTKKLEASFDVRVTWIQFRCPLVGIQGVSDLVIARLVLHVELVISYTYKIESPELENLPKYRDRTRPQRCKGSGE